MACSGFGTPPPNEPECTSVSAPRRSIWASMRPRIPVHMDGTSAAHIVVSEMTIMSQLSWSARLRSKSAKCGDPDSSSPSIRNFSETGGAAPGGVAPEAALPSPAALPLAAARQARRPRVCKRTWPLSSEAPRPRIWPSRSAGSNGGEYHSAEGFHRLDVVVTVDQNGRRARIVGRPVGEDGGLAG